MIYNYKSNELVQDIVLDSIDDLLEDIKEEYNILHRYGCILVYAPSYIAKKIIAKLLVDVKDTFVHKESEFNLLNKDDNEVVITISCDGMVFVECARWNNKQLKYDEDCSLSYVCDGFSNKDVDELSEHGNSILVFGFNEEDVEKKDIATTSKSTYKVNGKEVSKKDYDESVKDTLLKFHEILDEMEEFRKLFFW